MSPLPTTPVRFWSGLVSPLPAGLWWLPSSLSGLSSFSALGLSNITGRWDTSSPAHHSLSLLHPTLIHLYIMLPSMKILVHIVLKRCRSLMQGSIQLRLKCKHTSPLHISVVATLFLDFCRFYQEKFEDYPKSRKAFIPFIL